MAFISCLSCRFPSSSHLSSEIHSWARNYKFSRNSSRRVFTCGLIFLNLIHFWLSSFHDVTQKMHECVQITAESLHLGFTTRFKTTHFLFFYFLSSAFFHFRWFPMIMWCGSFCCFFCLYNILPPQDREVSQQLGDVFVYRKARMSACVSLQLCFHLLLCPSFSFLISFTDPDIPRKLTRRRSNKNR